MKFLLKLLQAVENISVQLKENNKAQKELIETMNNKINWLSDEVWTVNGELSWASIITSNLVEDSRDEWVMIDKEKAIKIVSINWKAERTETFTRLASLTKEERKHYDTYWIVLILPKC